jgi:hypothetical protein
MSLQSAHTIQLYGKRRKTDVRLRNNNRQRWMDLLRRQRLAATNARASKQITTIEGNGKVRIEIPIDWVAQHHRHRPMAMAIRAIITALLLLSTILLPHMGTTKRITEVRDMMSGTIASTMIDHMMREAGATAGETSTTVMTGEDPAGSEDPSLDRGVIERDVTVKMRVITLVVLDTYTKMTSVFGRNIAQTVQLRETRDFDGGVQGAERKKRNHHEDAVSAMIITQRMKESIKAKSVPRNLVPVGGDEKRIASTIGSTTILTFHWRKVVPLGTKMKRMSTIEEDAAQVVQCRKREEFDGGVPAAEIRRTNLLEGAVDAMTTIKWRMTRAKKKCVVRNRVRVGGTERMTLKIYITRILAFKSLTVFRTMKKTSVRMVRASLKALPLHDHEKAVVDRNVNGTIALGEAEVPATMVIAITTADAATNIAVIVQRVPMILLHCALRNEGDIRRAINRGESTTGVDLNHSAPLTMTATPRGERDQAKILVVRNGSEKRGVTETRNTRRLN